jgi:dimethylaniline monooxygenase (N-oxide forming)
MASYADHFKLNPLISMNTKVESATFDDSANEWAITTSGSESGTKHYDYLVACNGIFSDPSIPDRPGP